MLSHVNLIPRRTFLTLRQLHIEQVKYPIALNTTSSVEKWLRQRTVAHRFVHLTSLVVLVHQVVYGPFAQDPVTGKKVRLEN